MSRTVTVELTDDVFDALTRYTTATGTTPAELLARQAEAIALRRPVTRIDPKLKWLILNPPTDEAGATNGTTGEGADARVGRPG